MSLENIIKIVKLYPTIKVLGKFIEVPISIDFSSVLPKDREIQLEDGVTNFLFKLFPSDPNQKLLQLISGPLFNKEDIKAICAEFKLDAISYPYAKNELMAVREKTSEKNVVFISLLKSQKFHALLFQPNGRTDFDDDLPYFISAAEVELSDNFKKKIGW